ncbi:hypothetical protein [Alteromonas sp. M12]|uniref:hypothetical protein n=1 Tax=Alteromonas sp. M12 TaxID=3135644 RepID=UPI00319E0C74
MKSILLLNILVFIGLISGCASQPKVYIYGKYLDKQQTNELNEALTARNFLVEFNDFDFPTSITQNTILYSLLLEDAETLTVAQNIFEQLDIAVDNVQGLTNGNHWYTKNSLALFVFPAETSLHSGVFKQDLAQTYQLEVNEDCQLKADLELKPNGKYRFIIDNPATQLNKYLQGDWLYRQYPYLELRPDKEPYSSGYFQISKISEQDQISKIDFIRLTAIESKVVPAGCTLEFGLRY